MICAIGQRALRFVSFAEESKLRFRVLEVHRDVENPRVHIQLVCDWRIKPVEVVALTDIEPAMAARQ